VISQKEWQELQDRVTSAQQIAEASSDQLYDAVRHIEAFESALLEAVGTDITIKDFGLRYYKILEESNKLITLLTVEEIFEAAPGQTVEDFKCPSCQCEWGKPHGVECYGHPGD